MATKKQATAAKAIPNAHMAVEWWPIDRVRPYEKNARVIPQRAIDKVAKSIKQFGWRQPIVVEPNGVIIVGHVRRLAALQLDLTQVPVHIAIDLTAMQIRAYRLADNRTHDEALWDLDMLGIELKELKLEMPDLSMTGFEPMQIEGLLNGITSNPAWSGMPDFNQDNLMPWRTIKMHFTKQSDLDEFARVIGQNITDETGWLWYPKQAKQGTVGKRYVSKDSINPRYPVYVISKSRWESRLTSKALESMRVPYSIVVEPQEFEQYAAVIDPAKILTLPFSNLGQGSIPARNWVWEHAISTGTERHWILDDNIRHFFRLKQNAKTHVLSGSCFRAAEDYSDRYANVALSGMNYQWLAKQKQKIPPLITNTRIYSCILIKNDLPYRWRGRYNEDTDLSLRCLKDGWCTIQFNAFLADKQATMTMKGGNTDELYQGDGRLKMAEALRDLHSDVVTITKKWGRWQHQVDYRPFRKNKFIPKPGFEEPTEANNYGMELEILEEQSA